MKKRIGFYLIHLFLFIVSSACRNSQAQWDAQATQVAATIYATQTTGLAMPSSTMVPTSLPSKIPTTTPIPTFSSTPTPTVMPTIASTRTPNPSQILWRGDLHIHTICSDGINTYEEMVQRTLDLNFDFIAITDHDQQVQLECPPPNLSNEILGQFGVLKLCRAETRLLCIPGIELSSGKFSIKHTLFLGVDPSISPSALGNILESDVKPAIEKIHQLGGLAIAAHPFEGDFTILELFSSGFDAIGCGSKNLVNQELQAMSTKYGIPCEYHSDAHRADSLGLMYMSCRMPINSLADLRTALWTYKCRMK